MWGSGRRSQACWWLCSSFGSRSRRRENSGPACCRRPSRWRCRSWGPAPGRSMQSLMGGSASFEELARTTDSRPAPKSAEVPLSSGGAGSRPVLAFEELARTTDSRPAPKSAEVPLSSGGAGSRPVLAFEELARTTDSRPAPKSAEVPLSSGGAGSRPVLAFEELARTTDSRPAPKSAEVPLSSGGRRIAACACF